MELVFEWDDARSRLVRKPDSPTSTQKESVAQSAWLKAVRSDNANERNVARYKMAECAYNEREWYQPIQEVPGGAPPVWMNDTDKTTFEQVRIGIKQLCAVGSAKERDTLLGRSGEAERAARFLDYVRRVSACEMYNQGCVAPLLMARAVFLELNHSGDAVRINLLALLLRDWYSIRVPKTDPLERTQQARTASRNLGWLSPGWRLLWSAP